jgi:hypothetical protein
MEFLFYFVACVILFWVAKTVINANGILRREIIPYNSSIYWKDVSIKDAVKTANADIVDFLKVEF